MNGYIDFKLKIPDEFRAIAAQRGDKDPFAGPVAMSVPNCWVPGQGAGVAAALSVSFGVSVRDVDMAAVRAESLKQGVVLHGEWAKRKRIPSRNTTAIVSRSSRYQPICK